VVRIVLGVAGLLIVVAIVAMLARGQLKAVRAPASASAPASAPADLSRREGQEQFREDLQRSLQQGADRALQSGY
jgi:cytochrome c-type biogenesis protein CcmH/NrfG